MNAVKLSPWRFEIEVVGDTVVLRDGDESARMDLLAFNILLFVLKDARTS